MDLVFNTASNQMFQVPTHEEDPNAYNDPNNPWERTTGLYGEPELYYKRLLQHLNTYKSNVFIETGVLVGNGIKMALTAGYKKCYSIEITQKYFDIATKRYTKEIEDGTVEIILGDSSTKLEEVLSKVNEKATFWLDAHGSGFYNPTGEKLSKDCPTIEELEIIGRHHIKNHNILVDDMIDFHMVKYDGVTLEDLYAAVKKINPEYQYKFVDASITNNILACWVPD